MITHRIVKINKLEEKKNINKCSEKVHIEREESKIGQKTNLNKTICQSFCTMSNSI